MRENFISHTTLWSDISTTLFRGEKWKCGLLPRVISFKCRVTVVSGSGIWVSHLTLICRSQSWISELDCFLSVLTPSVPLLCRLVIKQGWLTSYKARLVDWLRFSVSRCQIRNSCKFMEIFNEVCFVNSHPLKTNIPEENLFQLTSSHLGQMLPSFVLTAGSR